MVTLNINKNSSAINNKGGDNDIELYCVEIKKLSKTIKTEDNSVDLYNLNIEYPCIENKNNNQIIKNLNAIFKEQAKQIYNNSLKNIDMCIEEYNMSTQSGAKPNEWSPYTTESSINIKYNENGILSYGFETYYYTGGAHGGAEYIYHTYNLKEGEEMQLDDILSGNANETKRNIIVNKIQNCPDEFFEDALDMVDSELQEMDFYLTDKGLVFSIPEYCLAPYTYGVRETEPLDYSDNKDLYKDFGQYILW